VEEHKLTGSWSGGGGAWSLLVHGGAGDVAPPRRAAHEEGCRAAAEAGAAVLAAGGSALDAVQAAVESLEDNPRYNAGTGASLDESGALSLDASIMDGAALRGGAVCALPAFQHPIAIAREVLRDGRHVLYAAEGAASFAASRGFSAAPAGAMITAGARERLAATLAGASGNWAGGTVGAVARDAHGHVAAATSTGGMVGKRRGRVGDSPILGAGTYADDQAGAVSGTGEGEGYLNTCIACRVCTWLERGDEPLDAAERAIAYLADRGSVTGGVIIVGADGRLSLARSTTTMSWAAAWEGPEGRASGH
jgi:L-asparaginase / beta-aspartyl-peptidase